MILAAWGELRDRAKRPAEASEIVTITVTEPVWVAEPSSTARHEAITSGEVGRVVERTDRIFARSAVAGAREEQRINRSPACGVAAETRRRAAADGASG